jgi:hypothetical protein
MHRNLKFYQVINSHDNIRFVSSIFICPKGHIILYPLASVCLSVRPSVRRSVRPLTIWFPEHNFSSIWPTMFKLHRMIVHIGYKTPIDFGVKRSKVKVTMTLKLKTVSGA